MSFTQAMQRGPQQPAHPNPTGQLGQQAAMAVGHFIQTIRATPGADVAKLEQVAASLRQGIVMAASCLPPSQQGQGQPQPGGAPQAGAAPSPGGAPPGGPPPG